MQGFWQAKDIKIFFYPNGLKVNATDPTSVAFDIKTIPDGNYWQLESMRTKGDTVTIRFLRKSSWSKLHVKYVYQSEQEAMFRFDDSKWIRFEKVLGQPVNYSSLFNFEITLDKEIWTQDFFNENYSEGFKLIHSLPKELQGYWADHKHMQAIYPTQINHWFHIYKLTKIYQKGDFFQIEADEEGSSNKMLIIMKKDGEQLHIQKYSFAIMNRQLSFISSLKKLSSEGMRMGEVERNFFKTYYLPVLYDRLHNFNKTARLSPEGSFEILGKSWKVTDMYEGPEELTQNKYYSLFVEIEDPVNHSRKIVMIQTLNEETTIAIELGRESYRFESFWSVFGLMIGQAAIFLVIFLLALLIFYRLFLLPRKLKQRLSQVQLEGIKSQLNPHFLFNSISSIQSLMNQGKTEEANTYLNDFSDLLRYHLDEGSEELVLLSEELDALQHYCQLEQLRSPFQFSIEVDTQLAPAQIELPNQILQIIVENAIKHGLRMVENPELNIRLQKMDQYLRISIADNGPGIHTQDLKNGSLLTKRKTHKGLELIREKIKLLKKKGIKLKMEIKDKKMDLNQIESGTLVSLDIPLTY